MRRLSERNKKILIRATFGILIIIGVKFVLEWIVTNQINQRVNIEIAKIDASLKFKADSFSLRVLSPGVVLKNITLFRNDRDAIKVKNTDICLGSWGELISVVKTSNLRLSQFSILIDGLAVYFENMDDKAKIIGRSLGLFNLHGSLELKANVDSQMGILYLDALKVDFKELFSLNFALQLQGIDFKSQDKMIEAVEVKGIKIDYFDMSMMGRAMNLETFPEFIELKNSMAKHEKKNEQTVDYSKRVILSDETNKKVTRLFMDFLLKPNKLSILQESNKAIKVKNFNEIYLARQKDLSEILEELGLKILVDSQVYL